MAMTVSVDEAGLVIDLAVDTSATSRISVRVGAAVLRQRNIAALQLADRGQLEELLAFARAR